MLTRTPRARRYKGYQIVKLHVNIRTVFIMEAGQTFQLNALTPGQIDRLVAIGWPHIKKTTAPERRFPAQPL